MQQIVASIPKQRILDLRKTYSRLTLAELAAKVDNPEQDVVGIIQRMVAAKETRATVAGDIVTFLPDDDYASPENMVKLQQARRLASWFNTELEIGNRNIGLNKKWLAKVRDLKAAAH